MNTKVTVLLIIFNRPDTTEQVFNSIKKYQPERLYIASDGARSSKPDEKAVVEQTRQLVLKGIDWNCEVKTFFRKKNVGCGRGVSEAITWLFENEEMGIILEDDCLPHYDFFLYCEEVLNKYRTDSRVMSIAGLNNFGSDVTSNKIVFSKYFRVWGWATWKRAWVHFKLKDQNLTKKELRKIYFEHLGCFGTISMLKAWKHAHLTNKVWDFFWSAACLANSGLTIIPQANLIKNIGIAHENSTNTKKNISTYSNFNFGNIQFPLNYPKFIHYDIDYDKRLSHFYMKQKAKALMNRILTLQLWN
jgi:hypothetical protein